MKDFSDWLWMECWIAWWLVLTAALVAIFDISRSQEHLEASAKAFGNFICIWYFKSLALVFWKITFFWILGLDFIVLIW